MYKIAGAIAAMMIVGTANAGPFGYDAGDEMPPAMEPTVEMDIWLGGRGYTGTNDDGMQYVMVSPPAGFHTLAVVGMEKTGICVLSVGRIIELSQDAEIHGEQIENVLRDKYGQHSIEQDDMTIWKFSRKDRDFDAIIMRKIEEYFVTVISISYVLPNFQECLAEVNSAL